MRVLYKWKECFRFDYNTDAYYLEIPKEEITNQLLDMLNKEEKTITLNDRYYEEVNNWAKTNIGLGLAKENCIYVLINQDVTRAFLCWVYYPYSGQWGGYCPFKYLYKSELKTNEYLKNAIEISELEDIKRIDNIITSKGLIVKDDD